MDNYTIGTLIGSVIGGAVSWYWGYVTGQRHAAKKAALRYCPEAPDGRHVFIIEHTPIEVGAGRSPTQGQSFGRCALCGYRP